MAKILISATNTIGRAMAGPAIRSWELAKALSASHDVVLASPNDPQIEGEGFSLISKSQPAYAKHFKEADVLITQALTCSMALQAKYARKKIIIDAYDPLPLEVLEQFKHHPSQIRNEYHNASINSLIFNFQMADSILCASEKQRDFWLGFLLSQKLITPSSYDLDHSLRHFIDVVPFGLPSSPPQKTGPGLREIYKFDADDKILLWGGGIWNWFDPLSLIRAMEILSHRRQDIKLVFMGVKNPDPSVMEMSMCREAIQLAKQFNLLDRTVFFNHGWVPYAERHNHLLDATIGVSTHFDHLETRYSFRTRLLDYIWAQLPMIATQGDCFAELIEQHELGAVVPYQNERAIVQAILSLLEEKEKINTIKGNLAQFGSRFYWTNVIKPIEQMISLPSVKKLSIKDLEAIVTFVKAQVREKGLKKSFQLLLKKLSK